jgi:hypothetical protein
LLTIDMYMLGPCAGTELEVEAATHVGDETHSKANTRNSSQGRRLQEGGDIAVFIVGTDIATVVIHSAPEALQRNKATRIGMPAEVEPWLEVKIPAASGCAPIEGCMRVAEDRTTFYAEAEILCEAILCPYPDYRFRKTKECRGYPLQEYPIGKYVGMCLMATAVGTPWWPMPVARLRLRSRYSKNQYC